MKNKQSSVLLFIMFIIFSINSSSIISYAASGGIAKDGNYYGINSEGDGEQIAENSNVIIDSDDSFNMVFGGKTYALDSYNATSNNNIVQINSGNIDRAVYGGASYSEKGISTSKNNTISITNGNFNYAVGGDAETSYGDAISENNTVNILGGEYYSVIGGEVDPDNKNKESANMLSDNNKVYFNNAKTTFLQGALITSMAENGVIASNNYVYMNNSIAGEVFGAYIGDYFNAGVICNNGLAVGNKLDIINSTVDSNKGYTYGGVFGGYIYGKNSSANENIVNLKDSTILNGAADILGGIAGGYARAGSSNAYAKNNILNINNVNTNIGNYVVSGGWARAENGTAVASENNLNIDNINGNNFHRNPNGGYALGYEAISENNYVVINNSNNISVIGGSANSTEGKAITKENIIELKSGEGIGIYGSESSFYYNNPWGNNKVINGYAESLSNKINIYDGNEITVYGSRSSVQISTSRNEIINSIYASASNNYINISGGNIIDIYGGMINVNGNTNTDNIIKNAINNTIIISGNTKVSGYIYGGYVNSNRGNIDVITGNTIELHTYNLLAKNIANFENYYFILPRTIKNNDTVINLTNEEGTDISNSNIGVAIENGTTSLQRGDTVTLIKNTNGLNSEGYKQVSLTGMQGVSLEYDFDLSTDDSSLYATVSNAPDAVRVNKQTKALSEGALGAFALTLQGSDLVAGQGMQSARRALEQANNYGFVGFGTVSGASMRYNTGSHVDVQSLSLMTGLAWGGEFTSGRLTVGAFFEYGNGSYNTHNSFDNAASVDGNGNSYYLGGGILGRFDFAATGPGHFYAEASGRIGNLHNNYDNSDLRDAFGRQAEYETDTPYYGAHFGAGYIWDITDKASLDIYGKYFWTRQESNGVTLSTGENVEFDVIDSHRLRLGGTLSYTINEYVSPYIGAAWEHEFNGKVYATTNGYDIDQPDLTGSTGIGELGFSLTPSASVPLTIDLGVQGYIGKREGVSGALQIKYEF